MTYDFEMSFRNPEFVREFRDITKQELEDLENGKVIDPDLMKIHRAVIHYFPNDRNRQLDMICFISEALERGKDLGLETGHVPESVLLDLASKWGMEFVMFMEIMAFAMSEDVE